MKALKEDKHEIFRAASDAQKIADYCLQFAPEKMKTISKEQTTAFSHYAREHGGR